MIVKRKGPRDDGNPMKYIIMKGHSRTKLCGVGGKAADIRLVFNQFNLIAVFWPVFLFMIFLSSGRNCELVKSRTQLLSNHSGKTGRSAPMPVRRLLGV